MIDRLIVLLKPALLCVDGKSYRPQHVLAALVAFPVDILLAHTTWAALAGWPKRGEWTISHTLERLCHEENAAHPDHKLFVELGRKINRVSPHGRHIKILATNN